MSSSTLASGSPGSGPPPLGSASADLAPTLGAAPAPSTDEADRLRALNRMKLLATGLLVLAAVVFVVARQFDTTVAGGRARVHLAAAPAR